MKLSRALINIPSWEQCWQQPEFWAPPHPVRRPSAQWRGPQTGRVAWAPRVYIAQEYFSLRAHELAVVAADAVPLESSPPASFPTWWEWLEAQDPQDLIAQCAAHSPLDPDAIRDFCQAFYEGLADRVCQTLAAKLQVPPAVISELHRRAQAKPGRRVPRVAALARWIPAPPRGTPLGAHLVARGRITPTEGTWLDGYTPPAPWGEDATRPPTVAEPPHAHLPPVAALPPLPTTGPAPRPLAWLHAASALQEAGVEMDVQVLHQLTSKDLVAVARAAPTQRGALAQRLFNKRIAARRNRILKDLHALGHDLFAVPQPPGRRG